MVGKTHSGKTTFGKELEEKINGIVIQTDPITLFLKNEYYVNLDQDHEHDGSFSEPSLKVKIFNVILEHIIKLGKLTPILTNSNMHQKMRTQSIERLQNGGYQVIGVYLNLPENILNDRVDRSNKSTDVLNVTKDFHALIIKQRKIFIEPRENEFDYFFEINSDEIYNEVEEKIINLINKG